jgi:hypothetical protein
MSSPLRFATTVAMIVFVITSVAAQTVPIDPFSAGRRFVIAFPDTVGNERVDVFADTRLNDAAIVMVYSAVPTRITITGGNGIARWSGTVDSARFTTIDLMRPEFRDPFGPVSPDPTVQRKNAFKLEAEHPVIVYCFLETIWGGEAWTPLPVEAWGTEYYVAAWPGDVVRNVYTVNRTLRTRAQAAPSEIVLVAAYDNTQIAFYPNGAVLGPRTLITLDANEAYQIRSFVDTLARTDVLQPDLGGSYIVATKPIGVISGNTRHAIIDERAGVTKNSLKSMVMEALAPVDEHGQAMVYMPVFDDLRVTGIKGEPLETKRPGELVRVFGTASDLATGQLSSAVEAPRPISVQRAGVQQIRLDGFLGARYLTTDAPLQAVSAPAGVIRAAAGGGYDTWAAFMVELVPREQWTSFAPFFAPSVPVGMRHYINIVTDTFAINDIWIDGKRFRMNMGNVPNSDLVWGTMEVPTYYQHYIEGRNGARFAATMYGLLPGSERTINSTYREYLALSYGMALAPARRALRLRDSLALDSTSDCRGASIFIRSAGGTVETIRRTWIDSSSNMRLTPASALSGPMITPQTLRLEAIDPTLPARATISVEDRAGNVRSLTYARDAELITLDPTSSLAFGEAMSGDSIIQRITIRNRSAVPVVLRSARLALGRAGFGLADEFVPQEIAPGAATTLRVRAVPSGSVGVYGDTLLLGFACSELRLPVSVSVVEPCLEIGDVDFGTVEPGTLVTRTLRVCNRGKGRLELLAVAGDSSIVWSDPSFTINPVFLDLLRARALGPSECVDVEVFFIATMSGRYETVAHVLPNAGSCRDSSRWSATVSKTTGIDDRAASLFSVVVDRRSVGITIPETRDNGARVLVYDMTGRHVAGPFSPGGTQRLRWDASAFPAGVYYCSLLLEGRMIVRPIVLR